MTSAYFLLFFFGGEEEEVFKCTYATSTILNITNEKKLGQKLGLLKTFHWFDSSPF